MDIDREKIVVMRIKRKATEPPLSALGAFLPFAPSHLNSPHLSYTQTSLDRIYVDSAS
jgi:hypothetical protein